MKQTAYLPLPFTTLEIIEEDEAIVSISFTKKEAIPEVEPPTLLLQRAVYQLKEYIAGKRQGFDLPLRPNGTAFQQQVWTALCAIPYGETRSYKQVAQSIGRSSAARAVGMANNKNPIAIVIPCHRVVGANGRLVGYAGGLDCKEYLLQLETQQTALQH